MRTIIQASLYNLMVFMTDGADHVTGKSGLTLVITASKDGAAFASINPVVTDRGSGWYSLALTGSHTDTQGDLAFHIEATSADPSDLVVQVGDAAAAVWGTALDGVYTSGDLMRILAAVAAGKTDISDHGNGTAHVEFRNVSDSSLVVAAEMTGSERTSVAVTP